MKKLCTLIFGSLTLGLSAQTQQLFFEDFANAFNNDMVLNSTSVNSTNAGDNTWTVNNVYSGGNVSIFVSNPLQCRFPQPRHNPEALPTPTATICT